MTVEKIKDFIAQEHNKKFKCSTWFYYRLNAMLDELEKEGKEEGTTNEDN